MRVRRVLSALSPALFFIGCDLFAAAFDDGYRAGYGCVDAVYGCYEATEDARRERALEVQAWEDACRVPIEPLFVTDEALSSADAHCAERRRYGARVVVCDDPGEDPGTHPPDCSPYQEPFGVVVDGDYTCPGDVAPDKRCLCCDEGVLDEGRDGCGLPGRWCFNDDHCCSGSCTLDLVEGPDGGLVEDDRGACD